MEAEAAEAERIKKAVEDIEDLGFGLLGVGGLIVAAAALPDFIKAILGVADDTLMVRKAAELAGFHLYEDWQGQLHGGVTDGFVEEFVD